MKKKPVSSRNIPFPLLLVGVAVLVVLAACWLLQQQGPEQAAAPVQAAISSESFGCPDCNVLFIGMTNVRADHLGVYGYGRNTTPNIDAFAQKSVVFESAFASSSWTLPSSATILTSLYPLQHKLMNRVVLNSTAPTITTDPVVGAPLRVVSEPYPVVLDENITTLMDVLGTRNYTTAAFTGGFDLSPLYGVTSHFDVNARVVSNASDASLSMGIRKGNTQYGTFNYSSSAFIDWVTKNRDKRFFAYVQGFDAHCPFSYPEENREFTGGMSSKYDFGQCYWTFDCADQVVIGNKTYYSLMTTYDGDNQSLSATTPQPQFLFSQEDVDYMVALYDGEVKLVDGYVGNILSALEREGLLNKTIVVIFSEHGDMFGKHGRFMRGGPLRGTFYDDVLRVPLIVYNPNFNASGQRRSALVSTVDFAPTVLDMLSIPAPAQFMGVSLKPVIFSGAEVHDAVFAASKFLPSEVNVFYSSSTFIGAVRTKDSKLILELVLDSSYAMQKRISDDYGALAANTRDSNVEFYDVSSDPQELVNVAASRPDGVEALKQRLFSWLKNTER